jgi:hypothetical protein
MLYEERQKTNRRNVVHFLELGGNDGEHRELPLFFVNFAILHLPATQNSDWPTLK